MASTIQELMEQIKAAQLEADKSKGDISTLTENAKASKSRVETANSSIEKQTDEIRKQTEELTKQEAIIKSIEEFLSSHSKTDQEQRKMSKSAIADYEKIKNYKNQELTQAKLMKTYYSSNIDQSNKQIAIAAKRLEKEDKYQNGVKNGTKGIKEQLGLSQTQLKTNEELLKTKQKDLVQLKTNLKEESKLYTPNTAIGKKLHEHELNKALEGGAPSYGKVMAADMALQVPSQTFKIASGGMSSGQMGVMQGVGDMAKSLVKGAAPAVMGALGGLLGPEGAVAGAAIGAFGADMFGELVSNAIQAYGVLREVDATHRKQMGIAGRLNGFGKGTVFGGVMGPHLSSEETTGMIEGMSKLGMDTTSKANKRESQIYAANVKVWGDTVNDVLKNMISTTDDYQSSLENVDDVYANSRKGAKNLNIELSQMAIMYSQIGMQARYMGIDATKAGMVVDNIVKNKDMVTNLRDVGLDMSTRGSQIMTNAMDMKSMSPTMQYYYGSNLGKENVNPLDAMYRAQIGSTKGASYNEKTGSMTYGSGMNIDFLKAEKQDMMNLMGQGKKSGLTDTQAFQQTSMILKGRGWNEDKIKLLGKTEASDFTTAKFAKEMENVEKEPLSYLKKLVSLQAIDENIKLMVASLSAKYNPLYSPIAGIADNVGSIADYLLGNTSEDRQYQKTMNQSASVGKDLQKKVESGELTQDQANNRARVMDANLLSKLSGSEAERFKKAMIRAVPQEAYEANVSDGTPKYSYEYNPSNTVDRSIRANASLVESKKGKTAASGLSFIPDTSKTFVPPANPINIGGGKTGDPNTTTKSNSDGKSIKMPGKMSRNASSVILELDQSGVSDVFKSIFQSWG
jgi:hypothetical protein